MFNKKRARIEEILEMRKREREKTNDVNEKELSSLSIEDFSR